ncbi:MAG: PAS domain S-box protein, partial [Nitrospirae bacterium]
MRTSLWKKLLIVFLGVYTCAVGILASFTYHSSRATMIAEFAIRGQELAKALAYQSKDYYLRQDVEGFTNLLQALAEAQGVLAVLAYDRAGALWIEFSTIALHDDELALVAPTAVWHRDLHTRQGMGLAEFGQAIPAPVVGDAPLGWIRLLVDRHPLEEGLRTLLLRTLIGSSFVALVGGTIFVVLLRRSLRVITSLTDATQQIAKGDLMVSVPVTSEDELGTLAECFNRMTSALHRTTVSKHYVETIIASLLDSLVVVDWSGTIQTVNDATLRVLGYDRHELIGHPIDTIIATREPVLALEALLAHDRNETFAYREVLYRTKDGTHIPMLFSAGVMRDEAGIPQGLVCAAQNMTEQKQAEAQWHRAHRLLHAIHRAQSQFIAASEPHTTFQALLTELLVLTDSPFGFIGERLVTETGEPYLNIHAISNLSWDEETRARFQAQDQPMAVVNLQTVFGQPLLTGRPIIDNHPSQDPRYHSLPIDPPLTAFLGIPFFAGTELVGMVALANRPGGYADAMIEFLQPLLSTCGNLIEGYRNEQRRAEAEAALRASLERFDMAVKGSQDGI